MEASRMIKCYYLLTITLLLITTHIRAENHESPHNQARINVKVEIPDREAPTFFRAVMDQTTGVTSARGTAVFLLDESGLFYRITVSGLTGNITAAHFHNAASGATGSPVRTLAFTNNTAAGTWKPDDAQPLTPALIEELNAGRIYVNVHTAANSGGEVRGQVTRPAGPAFWTGLNGDQEILAPASVTPPEGATAPAEDNVGFPEGYKDTYSVFYQMDRLDNRQKRVIYANSIAASVTEGEPFPLGSILVMETNGTVQDELGHVQVDDAGGFVTTGRPPFLFLMRKEAGFGEEYGEIRNGEWEYAAYRPTGANLLPSSRTTSCAT